MTEKLRFSQRGWFLLILSVLLLPTGAYYGFKAWTYYSMHVTTDNAYVQADSAQITPRIPGTVAEVLVSDNWWVKPGQVLVRLDPRDYEVHIAATKATFARAGETVDQLSAAVGAAEAQREAARAQVEAAQAEVAVAQADFHQAELDFRRAQELFEEQVISIQQSDRAKTQYDTALSRLHTKQRQLEQAKKLEATRAKDIEQAKATFGGDEKTPRSEHSIVKQAEAAVREAELNASYCTLVAPIEGMVSRKAVEVGQRVQPGQPLMAIVPLHRIYIEANYKETQLTHVRVGQPVEIEADIYPGYVYRGTVDSLSAGTGAAFSLLPPENATGNWVKVVQRLPVKITLSEPPPMDRPLRIGLSVGVTIDIHDHQGSLLSSLLQEEVQKRAASPDAGVGKPVSLPPSPLTSGEEK